MHGNLATYPWTDELEKTVINALSTTFGLDLLLFKDQQGGHVDTIFNARQGIYATEEARQAYENRPAYDSTAYHSHANYIATGQADKQQQQAGQLHDPYRNKTMTTGESRNLDHVISAYEIANDPGRILAGLDGVELANQSSNLQSTSETVNKSKKQKSTTDYLAQLPSLISQHKDTKARYEEMLSTMPRSTPQQQHQARVLEDKIAATENKIKELESIDPVSMKQRDTEARGTYENALAGYYSSTKFLHATANQAMNAGVKMGARQAIGMILAEIWFELRSEIPRIITEMKNDFSFANFAKQIGSLFEGIWKRVTAKYDEIVSTFRSGAAAGMFSSIHTTLANIFATTSKRFSKILRELWMPIVNGIKLMIFNPDKLEFTDLCKALVSVMTAGVAAVLGSMLHAYLLPLCTFPFGGEVASFVSALVTGIVTVGMTYFMIYSPKAQELWQRFELSMPYAQDVQKFRAINAELDRYLEEFSNLEFNVDADELFLLSYELQHASSEFERNVILRAEIEKRGIELPFEMGNVESTRNMLKSLVQ